MAKKPAAFACAACGDTFARWAGRCPSCGAMNQIAEISAGEARIAARSEGQARAARGLDLEGLDTVASSQVERWPTGLNELDRVLGGGLPRGAAIVLGGEPGIGKSTLLAQVAGAVAAKHKVLYVTAEESTEQVRARMRRLGLTGGQISLTACDDAEAIAGALRSGEHHLFMVDSIQLVQLEGIEGGAGLSRRAGRPAGPRLANGSTQVDPYVSAQSLALCM